MTMNDAAQTITPSAYTPAELSYLLAGRDTVEANRSRRLLGLAEVKEGDPSILAAVQSLRARGLVTVDPEGDVDIEQATKVVGFVLGTATEWTRLAFNANGRIEAIAAITSPQVPDALILRFDEFGNYQAVATRPGVHASQVTGTMIEGYLAQGSPIEVSVRRDATDVSRTLNVSAPDANGEFAVLERTSVPGHADVAASDSETTDRMGYLAMLEALLTD